MSSALPVVHNPSHNLIPLRCESPIAVDNTRETVIPCGSPHVVMICEFCGPICDGCAEQASCLSPHGQHVPVSESTALITQTAKLYGVTISKAELPTVKALTDILVGKTTTREYLATARSRCADIALEALRKVSGGVQ